MGLLSWVVAKTSGVPTVGEACRDYVVSYLAMNGIADATFTFVRGA